MVMRYMLVSHIAFDEDTGEGFPVLSSAPSPGLMSLILRRNQSLYRPAPGVAAPRLDLVPGGDGHLVRPPALAEYERAPESVLHAHVAAWLAQPEAQVSRQRSANRRRPWLNQRDLWQLRDLTAAALADIAGLTQAAIREWIEDSIAGPRRVELMAGADPMAGDTRSTRRRIERGRARWVRLGAWPWWPLVDAGQPIKGAAAGWIGHPRAQGTFVQWMELQDL